jgi:hypothetical protein
VRDRARLQADDERVSRYLAAERVEKVAERHMDEDRDDREQQKRECDRACRGKHRGEERSHFFLGGAFGRPKPAALSSFRPRADSTFLMNARPAA